MKGFVFYKMTGSGNDFVMLDGRATAPGRWSPESIQAVCDRRLGIGADGLVILAPEEDAGVRMTFWNADGSRAAMCGNAALCSARLSAHLEFAEPDHVRLLTDAGVVEARAVGTGDRAEICLPDTAVPEAVPAIVPGAGERAIWLGTVGVPHLIVLVDDVAAVDVLCRGKALRHHPAAGPSGANANFISPPPTLGAPWRIRTFERGVEGETLACGTGTVAAGIALAAHCGQPLPMEFVSSGGGLLGVRAQLHAKGASDVWLAGQGRLVFRGVWEG
jgi:diaminopimelate epimerase